MILQVVATMLFPTSDTPRAVRSCGRDARKKEKVRVQRGQREVMENKTLVYICMHSRNRLLLFVRYHLGESLLLATVCFRRYA